MTDQVAAGAVAGDPATGLAMPDSAPTTGLATRQQRHVHPGGRDDNGGQGRDKMPESHRTVKPQSEQHHPE